jgi:hypothetical protein
MRLTSRAWTSFVALGRGLIGARNQHRIDMSYLYYLPFCHVFISNDKLHKQVAPLFLSGSRMLVSGTDLKADLSALRSYDGLMSERDRRDCGRFPPLDGGFLTSKIYDAVMPKWREAATEPPIEITPERNKAIMKHLQPIFDAIKKAETA